MQRTRSNQDIQNSLVDLAVKYNELLPNTQICLIIHHIYYHH